MKIDIEKIEIKGMAQIITLIQIKWCLLHLIENPAKILPSNAFMRYVVKKSSENFAGQSKMKFSKCSKKSMWFPMVQ